MMEVNVNAQLIKTLREMEEQGVSKEERTKVFNQIPAKFKITICLGCGSSYEKRDCGCPAGSSERLRSETELEVLLREETIEITENQRAILTHTAHRTAGGFYCGDSNDMQILIGLGLMESAGSKEYVPDEYFQLTIAGKKVEKEDG